MQSIFYFFRSNTGHNNFITFEALHLFILFTALLVSIFIFRIKRESRKLELFIGSVLILQQVLLYIWYFTSKFNLLKEGLPLYHCRIAIIFIGIGLIFNKKFIMRLGSYWGIFTSILALLFPGLDPFSFPHITQFSYFIGHLFLLWGSVYLLFIKKVCMSKKDFKNAIIFTNVYHLLMLFINKIIGSNYAYMSSSPIDTGIKLSPFIYALSVIMIFNMILIIEYILINKDKKTEEKYEVQYG